ncbi:MAG: carbohydrate ABC transporter permease [Chloroflexi bacterium]|nr:carbohydrate ABC transporter permease [Chloroflexota bacterium]
MATLSKLQVKRFTRETTNHEPKKRISGSRILMWLFLILLLFVTIFPLYWVIRTAVTPPKKVYSEARALAPSDPTTQNIERVLGLISDEELTALVKKNPTISAGKLDFLHFVKNSCIVAGAITAGQTFFSSLAAYAFARLRFPLRNLIFYSYLGGLMVPSIVLFIPNFVLIRNMEWIGTYKGMIAPTFLMTPFAVFFMRQFFLNLNTDLEEAAKLDGATHAGIFLKIAMPLSKGPIFTLAILTFITSWNEYLWPFLVGRDEKVRVLTVALSVFRSQTPQGGPDWAGLMAGTIVAVIPTFLLFIFLGRKVVDSIQFSGFK